MFLEAIVGILIVFIILILLSLFIYYFGKIMNAEGRKSGKNKQTLIIQQEITSEDNDIDSDELIAVITASINAYMKENKLTPQCDFKVRSFKRVKSDSPVWNAVNKSELVDSGN